MATRSIRPSPTSPSYADRARREAGLTITELLITLLLFAILGTIAFGIYNSIAKLVSADTSRAYVQQNVRTSLDIMSADLREAGENLSTTYLVSGVEFSPSTQTLLVRRGLASLSTLTVCQTVSGSVSTIQVVGRPPGMASSATMPAGCVFSDGDSDGVSDILEPWRDYLTTNGSFPALLYNPNTNVSTRVVVTAVNAGNSSGASTLSVSGFSSTSNTFSYTTNSVIIPVDERSYSVVNGELRLTVNGNTAATQSLAYGIQSMNLLAYVTSGGATTSTNTFTTTSPWRSVTRLDLTLSGNNSLGLNRALNRTFTVSIFPRNVIQTR